MKRTRILNLALLATVCVDFIGCSDTPARPDIVLITMDTTRVDHLGCYGYARDTSPHVDRLAEDGVVYERAYSVTSWTLPSHASLFSGKFPVSHGARFDKDGPFDLSKAIGSVEGFRARGMSPDEATMASILTDAGYRTGAVVAGPWMLEVFGLGRGFESYDDADIHATNGRAAASVTDSAFSYVDAGGDEPFFLFLNYFDPHAPYTPPEEEFARKFVPAPATAESIGKHAAKVASYDGEIAYMDREIGRLLDGLRSRGLYDDCWIIVTADHGELLGEFGRFGHGKLLSEPEIHIPLIVKAPDGSREPARVRTRVQLVDVLPTVLDRLGIAHPPGIQGRPLPDVRHPIVAEFHPLPPWNDTGDWRAILHGDMKYVWNSGGHGYLADLKNDPKERRNIAGDHPDLVERLDEILRKYFDSLPRPGAAGPMQELDAETLRALDSLGYTGGDGR